LSTYHFFSDEESKNMNKEFMATLDRARAISKTPYVITAGYRTPEHNFDVGGVSDSAHCHLDQKGNPDGLAVDLVVNSDQAAGLILKGLYSVGLCRIGIYHDQNENFTHIHVDADTSKSQDVVWLKKEGT
jgi:zinc D-Ala-D-Ala carboxypeptidase